SGRVASVSARLAIALLSALLTMVVFDRAIAFFDLAYTPTRGRENAEMHVERTEFSVDVRLNALGFRERRLPSPNPPGVLRVVALGDSFTQGYGVEEDEAWPRRLESVLDARRGGLHEVVNLGVPGANPRDYLSHLRDPGLAYEPDVVIVMVMANDVQDRWVQHEFGVQFGAGGPGGGPPGRAGPVRGVRAAPACRVPGAVSVRVDQARRPARCRGRAAPSGPHRTVVPRHGHGRSRPARVGRPLRSAR